MKTYIPQYQRDEARAKKGNNGQTIDTEMEDMHRKAAKANKVSFEVDKNGKYSADTKKGADHVNKLIDKSDATKESKNHDKQKVNLGMRSTQTGSKGRGGKRRGTSKLTGGGMRKNTPGVAGNNQNRGYDSDNTMSKIAKGVDDVVKAPMRVAKAAAGAISDAIPKGTGRAVYGGAGSALKAIGNTAKDLHKGMSLANKPRETGNSETMRKLNEIRKSGF